MFADLHRPGDPLLLPNAWDHASGAALAAAGFQAIGTTSLGVAAAIGVPDGANQTKEATYDLAASLVHLPVPISVDAEHGFSEDPQEVAHYAQRLEALGVAGINLEDRNQDPKHHADVIAAVKQATSLFVNARTDTYWLGDGAETLERCRAYQAAGADGLFVPGIREDVEPIVELGLPLNVLFLPGNTVKDLAERGVARISTGSMLYRRAIGAAVEAATAIRDGEQPPPAPSYEEVDAYQR
jgi:2-methylisocitrate lyase-like PEP mutase family enzyme